MKTARQVEAGYLRQLLILEVQLLAERGVDVAGIREQISRANSESLAQWELKLHELDSEDPREPREWSVPDDSSPAWEPSREELYDRILGAWEGRIAGCILGKPFEMAGLRRPVSDLHAYLKQTGQFPLSGFALNVPDRAVEILGEELGCLPSQQGHIQFAETDDDLRYTFLGIEVAEATRGQVTTLDVARAWICSLPNGACFTAEQAALGNLHRLNIHESGSFGRDEWDYVRRNRNPFREFIGAAIRADGWAYAAAGDPSLAARMAQQDARLSHERNGEYSEMFFAAWIAGAFRWSLAEARERALALLPPQSRLVAAVRETLEACHRLADFEAVCGWVHERLGDYDPVHSINNAAICVAAVELGAGDYERSICSAVTMGLDTDCNGATVGSLLGASLGSSHLPRDKWMAPFNDQIRLDLPQFSHGSITGLAERTLQVWLALH